ncbi:hypothetical protein [Pseudomonas sp. B11(2017)]|uniref:hypothetical protein n=1 Tax=Pseudomonas sp. B11(2017) TaxID=1981748 RepID=UPI000A1E606A|nr:hypothetical protein [Pseudomonas sp. B11(2017)]
MPTLKNQITAAPLTIDGVSELDPDGHIPRDVLIAGTIGRIPRWPNFPADPDDFTILRVYWRQDGATDEIFTATYTQADDRPEFTFPITPEQMSVDGTAVIYYELEGFNGNLDPSPERKLTIDHELAPTLRAPEFPDVNFYGYINCSSAPPVWERIRVKILSEPVFLNGDECVLQWQGFDSLNGSPPVLTPVHEFRRTLSPADVSNGFVIDIPFDPYVRPMVDNDSALAQYTLFRAGVSFRKSRKGLVKIDRTLPGSPPCGGEP